MTNKERFIKTLKREKVEGQVPTFELVFYLTMEAFKKVHPTHRYFYQWGQMSSKEKDAQLFDQAEVYVETARKYNHSAIFVHPILGDEDNVKKLLTYIREISGDEYYLCMHGDPTYAIPEGGDMIEFSAKLYEQPEEIVKEQQARMHEMHTFASKINKTDKLLDGFTLCSDYCLNTNPFYSPEMFADLVAPTLAETIKGYREMGYYTIKHTDGNIMPILDQMVQCKPDALHSIDPQAGVDLERVSDICGDKVALCGNVNCGFLQTGTEDEVIADVRRCLRQGMKRGKGFIFCTSNCVYTGMDLKRYELMMDIYNKEGFYK